MTWENEDRCENEDLANQRLTKAEACFFKPLIFNRRSRTSAVVKTVDWSSRSKYVV